MYCRFWSSIGLLLCVVAPPLSAQDWSSTPPTYPMIRYDSTTMRPSDPSNPPAFPSTQQGDPSTPPGYPSTQPEMPHPMTGGAYPFAPTNGPVLQMPSSLSDGALMSRLPADPLASSTVGDGWYDEEMNNGLFFQYDYVLWAISPPNVTTIGDEGSEGLITTPDGITFLQENSLDSSWLDAEFTSGHRFEFGYQEGMAGIFAGVLTMRNVQSLVAYGVDFVPQDPYSLLNGYSDGDGDGIDDDLNGNHVFGRFGEDLGTSDGSTPPVYGLPYDGAIDSAAAVDTGDQVAWLVTYDTVSLRHTSELLGVEIMQSHKSMESMGDGGLEWIYGVRYLQYRETFGLIGTGGFLDATSMDVGAENDLIGPQIGLRWQRQKGYFTINAEGRFLPALNYQRASLSGHMATTQTPGGQNQPVSLSASGFNEAHHSTQFAPVGEFRLETICHINPWCAFRFGYTGMLAGGITRATEKVTYALPKFQLDNTGSREAIYAGGFTMGFELNR